MSPDREIVGRPSEYQFEFVLNFLPTSKVIIMFRLHVNMAQSFCTVVRFHLHCLFNFVSDTPFYLFLFLG